MRHLNKIRETNGGKIKEQDVPQVCWWVQNLYIDDVHLNVCQIEGFYRKISDLNNLRIFLGAAAYRGPGLIWQASQM